MPTVSELIRSCAELAGRFDRQVTTTTASDSSSLICSKYQNSVLSASEFANFWVLIETGGLAGEMGMLTNAGLAPTTGTLSTADAFSAPIAAGVTFSLYDRHRLPPYREGTRPGWLQIANQALERTWFEDTIVLAGVSDQIHYTVDLTIYPWFTDDTRIIEIQNPVTNTDDVPTVMSKNQWSWVSDGETRKLRFPGKPFRTGQTFTIKVNRPGNSKLKRVATARATIAAGAVTAITVTAPGDGYVNIPAVTISGGSGTGATATVVSLVGTGVQTITVGGGGSGYTTVPTVTITRSASDADWVDTTTQTARLITLNDECIPDVRILRPTMMALGFQALGKIGAPGQSVKEWNDLASEWEAKAVGIKSNRTPRDANEGVIRMRSSVLGGRRY